MNFFADFTACPSLALPVAGFLLVLLVETLAPGRTGRMPALLASLAIGLALVKLAVAAPRAASAAEPFGGMVANDALTHAASALLLLIGLAVIAMAEPLLDALKLSRGEFHALLLASLSGMLLLVAARDLLLFFLGIELLSIPLYVLAAFRRLVPRAVEAGFKYFLLGAFASGFLVYGIALLYGAAGDTHYRSLAALAATPTQQGALWHVGLAMVLVGAGFKVAAAPFHTWAPDVYQGAPTPVTAFMAAGVKTAAFGGLLRLALEVLPASRNLVASLAVIACLSMTVGNLGALLQTNLKRMLAWSSIGHAGYLLVGVLAAIVRHDAAARDAVLFYLGSYALVTLGAFSLIEHLVRASGEGQDLRALRGMSRRWPFVSAALALCFLSLAGVPLTAGFLGKLYVIQAAWSAGLLVPSLFLAGTSVIALGYYLRVIATLYMERDDGAPAPLFAPTSLSVVSVACSVGVLLIGLWPAPLFRLIGL